MHRFMSLIFKHAKDKMFVFSVSKVRWAIMDLNKEKFYSKFYPIVLAGKQQMKHCIQERKNDKNLGAMLL